MEEQNRDPAKAEAAPSAEPHLHIQSYWRFRDLLEAAPDGIFEVERDGTIVLLNAAAERMFGYKREELLGQLIEILVPESLRQRHHEHRGRYAEHPVTRPMGIGLELFARRKDGSEFPVEISLSPIRSTQGARVIAIVRDITSRKQAEAQINAMHREFAAELEEKNRQLEIRNREVERANRLKSEFLASISHELRTPLHTIIGFADLLAEELKGALNPDQKRFVAHIQHDSRHLLELINDILDLSKIESGRLELHPEVFKASDAIAETLAGLRPMAKNKQIDITEMLDSDLTITADRVRFKEIFYNLISNAIKFTPEKGHITVECEQRSDGAFFAVSDTGIGIEPSEHQAIFDKFYQLGSTTRGVREGTGLGLAITKNLVEMHGGRIWVESTPGQGSRFQFVLPGEALKAPGKQRQPESDSCPGPVLILGKEQTSDELAAILREEGYTVLPVSTIREIVEKSRTGRLTAVVVDLSAIGTESCRVLQDLRANEDIAQIPILALTTRREQNLATLLGANAVVRKPIEPASLLRMVQEHVRPWTGAPSRILVVDEQAEVRELLDKTLRSSGFLPLLAPSGKQALEILARSPISAALIDVLSLEMSGLGLILRIRQNAQFSKLPVIVLTSKEMDEPDAFILNREANAIFFKAFPWRKHLVAKIEELSRKR